MVSVVINLVIAVGSVAAWLSIMLGRGDDRTLAVRGWRSLKYYTVLSNLFSAGVSAAYLLFCLLPGAAPTMVLLVFKLAAASVVMITFLVTATLLGPTMGWKLMYQGGNFWLHLVLPLLAAADVCLFAPVGDLPVAYTVAPVAFTAIYAVGYLRPVLRYGGERDGHVYDFYHFLRWGQGKIWYVAVFMLLATWLIAIAYWLVNRLL